MKNYSFTLTFIFLTTIAVAQPANDDPCSATSLTVGASCTFGGYTNAAATASAGVPAPGCASYSGGDVWFSVTVPASGSITFDTNTGVVTDAGMAVYSGTCGSLTLVECDDDDSGNGLMSFITLTGQTPGATLWIRVWEFGNNNNGTFSICAYDNTPAAPANDNPCTATSITAGASCVYATYTNAGATASAGVPAPGCASYSGGDVWFSVTVPASGSINFDTNTGVITDGGMAIYSGTCGSLTLIECDDDDSPNGAMSAINLTGQTPGATLWIRIWEFGNNNNGTFQLCATDPGGGSAPANDDPCSATALTVNASCVYTTSTNAGATASAGVPAPGCASYSGGDVWFTVTVPATGNINFNSNTGVITDGGMAIYSGSCAALSLILCDDDGSTNGLMPAISLAGQTPGATLWVRFWEYGNNNNGTFDICASEGAATGPCGSTYNDNCANPAILTQGGGPFTGNTSTTFTADLPGNITSEFCGSIENNSWFIFTASATTETFDFTSISNCTWGDGVQAEVYSFTTDVAGCCTGFTSVSNCYNPATPTAGTVTASGLTIGNSYLLMVDGWAGDDCDFTISGWSVSGILPVSLTSFYGSPGLDENFVFWTTKSEQNNSHFIIEKSSDGVNFHKIGMVYGSGNSSTQINYSFTDRDISAGGLVYYRLVQVDYDGNSVSHGIVSIVNSPENISIFPNPSESELTILLDNADYSDFVIEYVDVCGRVISESVNVQNGSTVTTRFSELSSGVYFVRIFDLSGNLLYEQKVIKK